MNFRFALDWRARRKIAAWSILISYRPQLISMLLHNDDDSAH